MSDLPGAYLRELVELVARWKVAPEALFAGLPITHAQLADPATRVPLRVCEAIVARAHQLTHEPALALHVGTQMRLSSHGFLGFAAMTASTVREALELAARFASTRTPVIGIAVYVEGKRASLVIEERAELGALREFVILALVIGIWQLGQALTGKSLDGVAECAFPAPAYPLPDGNRLRFNRPTHRLVFAASILDLPLVSADVVASRLATTQLERELAAVVDAGLPARIRAVLAAERSVSGARSASAGARGSIEMSLPEVAKQLHLSTRTLKRKLAEHGTTFSAIRDDLRRQRALLLLENRALSIGEIAGQVGYTELPNFTRAFRKWTGMTPLAYRAR